MLKNLFIPLISLTILCSFMHAYFVSITEIDFNKKNKNFEISIKFIGHDLEQAINQKTSETLMLGTDKEHPKADSLILNYIQQNLEISTNKDRVKLKFVGKESNMDGFVYCYLKTEKVDTFSNIAINNSLLTQSFEKQENILYINLKNKQYNHRFNKQETDYNINLNTTSND